MSTLNADKPSPSWVQPRRGLPHLAGELFSRPCRVAYLGASVTAQMEGYRSKFHELLVQLTGQDHQAINAGFGGVGAISGVFTMDRQVLEHRPDLCFIEFSSGDLAGWTPEDELGPVLEGMVRKSRAVNCEVCFVYAYRRDQTFDTSNPVIAAYETVAAYYGIPSLNIGRLFQAEIAAGDRLEADILRDEVHTTPLGSELMAEAMLRGVLKCLEVPATAQVPLQSLFDRSFQYTEIVPPHAAEVASPENSKTGRFRFTHDYLQIGSDNEIRFVPDGELIGLFVIIGKDAGVIEVTGGGASEEYILWDMWCHYNRVSTVIFRRPLPAGEPVSIRLTEKVVDYTSCRRPLENTELIQKHLNLIGFLVRHDKPLANVRGETP